MKPLAKVAYSRIDFAVFKEKFLKQGLTEEAIERAYADMHPDKVSTFANDIYAVRLLELDFGFRHLIIQRIDIEPCRNWPHFQQIKNEVCGEESEAIEIYPAESRLMNMGNAYHLWVFPKGNSVPLGFWDGRQCNPDLPEFNTHIRSSPGQSCTP